MYLVRVSSGKTFEANENESLLDAGLRSGVTLAYSCRTGRCSTCKARVRTGATTATHDEIGLTDSERASQWILTCVRSAQSAVVLEVDDLADVHLFPAKTLPCKIQNLTRLSDDVVRIFLRLPPSSPFEYRAGQYIDVIGRNGIRRSYSIANAPATDKQIELHIRNVEGGAMSEYWFDEARIGDLLRLNGPLGTFFLRDIEGMDLVFLATGTGIAPVKAILETLAIEKQTVRSVSVFWGGRVPSDLYWNSSAAGLNQRIIPVLSKAARDWDGARGHVQAAFIKTVPDWTRTVIYACGSDAMIHDAKKQFTDAGLPSRRFFSDAFVCSASI